MLSTTKGASRAGFFLSSLYVCEFLFGQWTCAGFFSYRLIFALSGNKCFTFQSLVIFSGQMHVLCIRNFVEKKKFEDFEQ